MAKISWVLKSKTPRDYSADELRQAIAKHGSIAACAFMMGFSESALRARIKREDKLRIELKEQANG